MTARTDLLVLVLFGVLVLATFITHHRNQAIEQEQAEQRRRNRQVLDELRDIETNRSHYFIWSADDEYNRPT